MKRKPPPRQSLTITTIIPRKDAATVAAELAAQRQAENTQLVEKQRAELERIHQQHRARRASLDGAQRAELAVVMRRHLRELADLKSAQGCDVGPWVNRQPAPERLELERGRAAPLARRGES